MGVEGRDKQKILEAGALALSGQLGATVQRLRKAYNLSLSELSAAIGRRQVDHQPDRAQRDQSDAGDDLAAGAGARRVDRGPAAKREDAPFLEKTARGDTPMLVSDDGKCRLAIIGWIKTVEWLQAYEFYAEPGGVLESEAHQRGSVESLSLREGELCVEVAGVVETVKAGETLRYRCDRPHVIRNSGKTPAQATMVCILKAAAME